MAETIELEEPKSRVEKLLMVINQNLAGVAGVNAIRFEVVSFLPDTGEDNVIYLLLADNDTSTEESATEDTGSETPAVKHSYKAYIWLNECYQEIGGERTTGSVEQSDWNEVTEDSASFIKNKPAISTGTGRRSILVGGALEASAEYALAEGNSTAAKGRYSHTEGYASVAMCDGSHAEGTRSKAQAVSSHAEGSGTTASGDGSHAEGSSSVASGSYSHAEGSGTEATQYTGHAEGLYTKAGGKESHAEGSDTDAEGEVSHAEGKGTVARGDFSHVSGKYNLEDGGQKYAEIVGNGTYNERSNARTLDWDGNEWIAGKMTVGAAPSEDMDLTTKKYVDDLIAGLQEKIDALTSATT